jgi:hypothetical protein
MNNRFDSKVIVAFLCVAALCGCATKPATFAQQDPRVDLYAFRTFAFFGPATGQRSGAGYATLVGEQLKASTRAQMEQLGYVYDESDPDLRVNIVLAVQQKSEVRSTPNAGPLPYGAWRASNIETVDYREGTLAIDVVDMQRRALVWRGMAQDRISRKDAQDVPGTVRDAVREVFSKYPRKA